MVDIHSYTEMIMKLYILSPSLKANLDSSSSRKCSEIYVVKSSARLIFKSTKSNGKRKVKQNIKVNHEDGRIGKLYQSLKSSWHQEAEDNVLKSFRKCKKRIWIGLQSSW